MNSLFPSVILDAISHFFLQIVLQGLTYGYEFKDCPRFASGDDIHVCMAILLNGKKFKACKIRSVHIREFSFAKSSNLCFE
jgi:hypothetical protein